MVPGSSWTRRTLSGDFKVTDPDEGVAVGTVKSRGYFDYVNIGDQVIYPRKDDGEARAQPRAANGKHPDAPVQDRGLRSNGGEGAPASPVRARALRAATVRNPWMRAPLR